MRKAQVDYQRPRSTPDSWCRSRLAVGCVAVAVLAMISGVAVPTASAQRGLHGDFHGRDFHHFSPRELHVWRGGVWRHDWHDGRFAWWWVNNGFWYFYPAPIYPYPVYVAPEIPPPQVVPVPTGLPPAQFWYFCDSPRGYYPYVASCNGPWHAVPVTAPK